LGNKGLKKKAECNSNMAKEGKIQKVVLIDYDGPLAKDMKLDLRTIGSLKRLAGEGFRIAIITGRTALNMREFIGAIEKARIGKKVSVFCEHGCLELVRRPDGRWAEKIHEEARDFKLRARHKARQMLLEKARQAGFENVYVDNAVSLYFSSHGLAVPKGQMQGAVRKTVDEINARGLCGTRLVMLLTRNGSVEVLPENATKRTAARNFLGRIGGKYAGFAFGDMFSDRKPRVKTAGKQKPFEKA
jgi:hydroxymethylpyrimidine pyrophosphatase-like HAD family hydrolase